MYNWSSKSTLRPQKSSGWRKALAINLEAKWYGSLAEIGAGQEVARWFFRAGGAAGTVAKTISAYDMAISDVIYATAMSHPAFKNPLAAAEK